MIPFLGDLLAMVRLLRDRDATILSKVMVLLALAYVVMPLDAIPDAAPLLGWLDDVGIVLGMRVALHQRLSGYRYPLLGPKPVAVAAV